MSREPELDDQQTDPEGGLLKISVLSLIVGAVSGAICAAFRLTLEHADRIRGALLALAHGKPILGFVAVIVVCSVAVGFAAWLVRRFAPHASGSGIPHVEAVLNKETPPATFLLIPIKFLGGILAIGPGLALGREGPSVQMGASVAHLIGAAFRCKPDDCRALLAAGAGAGLATAFNAPIAGAVFVLEELVRKFDLRITITTLGASAGAIGVARVLLGEAPDFHVAPMPYPGYGTVPIHLALGAVAGFVGVAYNRAILGALSAADRLTGCPVEIRAGLTGAMVGLLAWFAPDLIGGGDGITQRALVGNEAIGTVMVVFVMRFGLGAVSYAARTPGGLFAPMLVLGAQIGLLFGALSYRLFPEVAAHSTASAVVGMAAFFTAVVRAPVTGVILVIELTGCFTLLLPMLSACFTAMLVPTLLGDPPIYDSLGAPFRKAKE